MTLTGRCRRIRRRIWVGLAHSYIHQTEMADYQEFLEGGYETLYWELCRTREQKKLKFKIEHGLIKTVHLDVDRLQKSIDSEPYKISTRTNSLVHKELSDAVWNKVKEKT